MKSLQGERFVLPRLIFVLCLCLLSFLYGAASIYFRIFPYPILKDAKVGLDAWREIIEDDQNFEFVDENGHPEPYVAQLNGEDDDDSYILMTGHPYTFISECPQLGCMAWIMNREGEVFHMGS
jgi:hypothetical protein